MEANNKGEVFTASVKTLDQVAEFFNNNSRMFSVRWHEKRVYDWNSERQNYQCYHKIVGERSVQKAT